VERLLAELTRLRIGATFNQYAEAGPDDVPGAAAIRLENLRAYLAERPGADVVCLGEAGGYQGMRWSGIAFTSERDLLRWGAPYRTTCAARTWSEPSGTIVHKVLVELVRPRTVVAVGRIAESVLPAGTAYVRHPANAGGPAFREGMRAILAAP
jgi:hypothetical protein